MDRRWGVDAVTAVAAIVALSLVGCGSSGGSESADGGQTAEQVPQSAPPESESEQDDAGVSTDGAWTWERVGHRDEVFGDGATFAGPAMFDVVSTSNGFAAVGHRYDADAQQDAAAFWFSSDGIDWELVAVDTPGSYAWSAAVGGDGTVAAVGSRNGEPAVWVSSSERSWELVDQDWNLTGAWAEMNDVARTEDGFIATGRASGPIPAMWTSQNGSVWTRLEPEAGSFRDSDVVLGGTSGGPGFILVGYNIEGSPDIPKVWTSPDGTSWDRVALSSGSGVVSDVALAGERVIAVGSQRVDGPVSPRAGMVWLSSDGSSWSPGSDVDALTAEGREAEVTGVRTTTAGIVAVGSAGSQGGVWVSEDGASWKIAHPGLGSGWVQGYEPNHAVTAVADDGSTMVAVGHVTYDPDRDGRTAAVWVRDLQD